MGYDTWLPSAPKVEKPRSTYNAASLAYIGDCIYEVCVKSCCKMGAEIANDDFICLLTSIRQRVGMCFKGTSSCFIAKIHFVKPAKIMFGYNGCNQTLSCLGTD